MQTILKFATKINKKITVIYAKFPVIHHFS